MPVARPFGDSPDMGPRDADLDRLRCWRRSRRCGQRAALVELGQTGSKPQIGFHPTDTLPTLWQRSTTVSARLKGIGDMQGKADNPSGAQFKFVVTPATRVLARLCPIRLDLTVDPKLTTW